MQKQLKASVAAKTESASKSGNKEAAAAAKETRRILHDVKEPGMLEMRNRVLDAAIERFRRRGGWINGYLAMSGDDEIDTVLTDGALSEVDAQVFRATGTQFCAIGGLAAELGNYAHSVIQASVNAVYDALPDSAKHSGKAYGFSNAEAVYEYNDNQKRKGPILHLFRKAKTLPLREN